MVFNALVSGMQIMTTSFSTPYFSNWPKIQSEFKPDSGLEADIASIIEEMTVEEKVGQMIQPELREITAEEMIEYKIGSILNGGGSWPDGNKRASAAEWTKKADMYWAATEQAFSHRPFRIPFMWATDAVHGHNNVFSSTVFPHNIGLGCARDPEMIRKIGRITALEVAATGLDWTFAPTVATPRDLRWGRVYEGYSEDPEITYAYAGEMVKGLQGNMAELKDDHHVISNVKHWVGDGGTMIGIDRGINRYSEDLLRNIHAMGYFSGLEAGAQVVMSSFNSWDNESNYDHDLSINEPYNKKIHGSQYLLTDVLKEQMGFDGLVVTDWNGHAEISKCSNEDARYAINAGNDVLMIPVRQHWQAVYHNTVADIQRGSIPMSRIDDAVTRILRVKMRAGLWNKPKPSMRALAGDQTILGAPEHRSVAREAVRKSLVLLKNKNEILPLKSKQCVILTGSAANDLQKQSGGWNLTWQGDENALGDFPGATTVKMGLEAELGKENVIYDPDLTGTLVSGDTAIVVFGEDPYAEMMGDIKAWQSLEFAKLKRSYASDCAKIAKLHSAGVKVVSIFFSGRPLYVNKEIARSDAFVAAFLPGSEGKGIIDLLVADDNHQPKFDFHGVLSFSWPNKKSSYTVNRIPPHIGQYELPENEQDPQGEHAPLFDYGYGLNYTDKKQDRDLDHLEFDTESEVTLAQQTHMYGIQATIGDYQCKVADTHNEEGMDVSRNNAMKLTTLMTTPFNYQQQQDAVEFTFLEGVNALYIETTNSEGDDFSDYKNGLISFELKVLEAPSDDVMVTLTHPFNILESETGDVVKYALNQALMGASDEFIQFQVPCQHFFDSGVDLSSLHTVFSLTSNGRFKAVLANVYWQA
ncbi:glycoside hydrolase family 3 N-terminal domain-containing protein [Vibrio sp. YMD68]|uniref:glycoside hydrolase family 3 protein n=1 Tax=Vibrio sp. YMD68 TaxID=3042300 RepID=UPI00249B36BB|nr:glycoside hydrolase family 3 protein [Vibrio sp. YMD68]WGV98245.1 glycoside hydrolase family 3 N-terminal domain-containing protein [Vibrio sp. YMD68]